MSYWWVNQNQTYRKEVTGGFLWSPQKNNNGARNQFYENMRDVLPGDIIFSFSDTRIKALGLATDRCRSSAKPEFGAAGAYWDQEGWLVPVEFRELSGSLRPKDHIEVLRPLLPAKYSPLQANGDGLQGVYLARLSDEFAETLLALLGAEASNAIESLGSVLLSDDDDSEAEAIVCARSDIGPTTKAQLVQARRGQGLFRSNVRLNEKCCRITGVRDAAHLRASHIKPWRLSSDEEKLDGDNGLLLAPHIDHLFDKGFISFTDTGSLLISPRIDRALLSAWCVPVDSNVGRFSSAQATYLAFHRQNIFKAN